MQLLNRVLRITDAGLSYEAEAAVLRLHEAAGLSETGLLLKAGLEQIQTPRGSFCAGH